MNKLANARSDETFHEEKTEQVTLQEIVRCFSAYLDEVYSLNPKKDYFLREKQSFQLQFPASLQDFIAAKRNIPHRHFVYTGAAPYRAAQGEIQKTPRWQPRGHDTQFFRPLVQEEEVSSRGAYSSAACVSTPSCLGSLLSTDSILSERKLTRMRNSSLFRCVALLAAIALAVPVFAKPFSKNINLAQTAKLGKAELQAGEYRLLIDGNKATVQKGGKVVAESEGRWEDRSAKSSYDSLLITENGQVKEVRFSGQSRVFVFSE